MTHTKRLDLFKEILRPIADHSLRSTCIRLLDDTSFWHWPAAITFHHAYEGGLIAHTLEVAEIALHIANQFPQVNRDVLIAAALWHDYGKIFEYAQVESAVLLESGERVKAPGATGKWLKEANIRHLLTPNSAYAWIRDPNAMSHILSSAIQFVRTAVVYGVDEDTIDQVVHCIHAHHGPVKEWGSPEAPRTIEALILHQADMLSAGYGATKEAAR